MLPIEAVTFDLWDTLVVDDSDEVDRAALGLPSKAQARFQLFFDAALGVRGDLDPAQIRSAFEAMNQWFEEEWKGRHRTPHISARLLHGFELLGLGVPRSFDALVENYSVMEVRLPPQLCDGARPALAALAREYRLGIVSDAIVTPGSHLRRILAGHGLLHFFSALTFSDEAGAAKPSQVIFADASAQLGIPAERIVHVGDRETNDVAGPHSVGARAVLYTGSVDRGSAATTADAVCTHLNDLGAIIGALVKGSHS